MPGHYPDYPSRRQVLEYARSFAEHFDLKRHVQFNAAVKSAKPFGEGWRVELSNGETREFAGVVCATGMNWDPRMAQFPGEFSGVVRHSQSYRSAQEFLGKRVLVVGGGNSGCDIACDAAANADKAYLSLRRGYHFIPKHIWGTPADEFAEAGPKLPLWLEKLFFTWLLRLTLGDVGRYGLPKPDHKILETHPLMNTQVLHYLSHGDLAYRPNVERFEGQTVHFVDGSSVEVDEVVVATGYHRRMPALEQVLPEFPYDNYLTCFSKEYPSLFTLGYVELNAALYPRVDKLADLVAQTVVRRAAGHASIAKLDALVASPCSLDGGLRLVNSPRHIGYSNAVTIDAAIQGTYKTLGWSTPGAKDFESLSK